MIKLNVVLNIIDRELVKIFKMLYGNNNPKNQKNIEEQVI
jgi:hypothetical protein